MIKQITLALIYLLFSFNCFAVNWYVDKDSKGLNNGSSIESAWYELNQIKWNLIYPGDIIYLAGGNYTNYLSITKSGNSNAPITIKVYRQINNKIVYIPNGVEIKGNWITIDGSLDDNFPINIPVKDLWNITNNIGIYVSSPNYRGININAYQGNKVYWVKSHDSGWAVMTGRGLCHGISHAYTGTNNINNTEIAYCISERSKTDGISIGGNSNPNWGDIKINHCIIHLSGDDGVQIAGGVDVNNNIIGPIRTDDNEGHPDTVQTIAFKVRIYNNKLYAYWNSWVYFESAPKWGVYDWMVYGNLCIEDKFTPSYGLSFGTQWFADDPNFKAYWNTFIVANNTIVGGRQQGIVNWWTKPITNLFIINGFILNNIIVDSAKGQGKNNGFGLSISSNSTNTIKINHNIIAGWTTKMTFDGKIYNNGELFNSSLGFIGNSSLYPNFVNTNDRNYELHENDIAAHNRGNNLYVSIPTNILANMPDYNIDMNGSIRGQDGSWDIGAFESPTKIISKFPESLDKDILVHVIETDVENKRYITLEHGKLILISNGIWEWLPHQ